MREKERGGEREKRERERETEGGRERRREREKEGERRERGIERGGGRERGDRERKRESREREVPHVLFLRSALPLSLSTCLKQETSLELMHLPLWILSAGHSECHHTAEMNAWSILYPLLTTTTTTTTTTHFPLVIILHYLLTKPVYAECLDIHHI